MLDMIRRFFSATPANPAVKLMVDEAILGSKVVVFSKTYCPYCTTAKGILAGQPGLKVLELDQSNDGSAIQAYLAEKLGVGRVTVPQVFISGKNIGGCTDLQNLQRSGKLAELLK